MRRSSKTGTFESQNRATSSTLKSPIVDKIGPEISAPAGSDHQTIMQQSSVVRSVRLRSQSEHLKVKNNAAKIHYSKMGGKPPLFRSCSKFQIKFDLTFLFVL
jgi:hypothetical protein